MIRFPQREQHRALQASPITTQPVGQPIPVTTPPAAPMPFNYNAPLLSPVGGVAPPPFNYNAPLLQPMNSIPGTPGVVGTDHPFLRRLAASPTNRGGFFGGLLQKIAKAQFGGG